MLEKPKVAVLATEERLGKLFVDFVADHAGSDEQLASIAIQTGVFPAHTTTSVMIVATADSPLTSEDYELICSCDRAVFTQVILLAEDVDEGEWAPYREQGLRVLASRGCQAKIYVISAQGEDLRDCITRAATLHGRKTMGAEPVWDNNWCASLPGVSATTRSHSLRLAAHTLRVDTSSDITISFRKISRDYRHRIMHTPTISTRSTARKLEREINSKMREIVGVVDEETAGLAQTLTGTHHLLAAHTKIPVEKAEFSTTPTNIPELIMVIFTACAAGFGVSRLVSELSIIGVDSLLVQLFVAIGAAIMCGWAAFIARHRSHKRHHLNGCVQEYISGRKADVEFVTASRVAFTESLISDMFSQDLGVRARLVAESVTAPAGDDSPDRSIRPPQYVPTEVGASNG